MGSLASWVNCLECNQISYKNEGVNMAKGMTKTALVRAMAEKMELTKQAVGKLY